MRILVETGSHKTEEAPQQQPIPQEVEEALFNAPVASSGEVSIVDVLGRISNAKYKKSVEVLLLREIFSGIKKIVFASKTNNPKVQQIAEWLNTNYVDIFKVIYSYGVLPINFTKRQEVMDITLVKRPTVRIKDDELKCNAHVAIFTDEMQLVGVSLKTLLRALVNDITEIIARDSQINKNLGLLGIVSRGGTNGTGVILPGDLEKIEKKLNSRGEDFFGLITSESDLRFLKIELPIAQLQLAEKLQQKLQLACAVIGVPYILLNTGGNMTYENQTEARVKFYETTVKAFAEIMLEAGRKLVKNLPDLVPSTDLDYTIEQQTIKTDV